MKKYVRIIQHMDRSLLYTLGFLLSFGLLMIYSSSVFQAYYKQGEAPNYFLYRTLVFDFLFILSAFFTFAISPKIVYRYYRIPLIISAILLWYLVLGKYIPQLNLPFISERNGAYGWLIFGPFSLQPLEIAKISSILYLSVKFFKARDVIREGYYYHIRALFVLFSLVYLPIFLQPDVGGLLSLAFIFFALALVSGMKKRMALGLYVTFIGSIIFVYNVVFTPNFVNSLVRSGVIQAYQAKRILVFISPFHDDLAAGAGYQVKNAIIALGANGLTGLGFGNGVLKEGYIPETHTDMIFAVIAEELGFFGVAIVLLGLGYIGYQFFRYAFRAQNGFYRMYFVGLATLILGQTIINIGGLTAFLPLTGVTLPFISYGGSSGLFLIIGVALALRMTAEIELELDAFDPIEHVETASVFKRFYAFLEDRLQKTAEYAKKRRAEQRKRAQSHAQARRRHERARMQEHQERMQQTRKRPVSRNATKKTLNSRLNVSQKDRSQRKSTVQKHPKSMEQLRNTNGEKKQRGVEKKSTPQRIYETHQPSTRIKTKTSSHGIPSKTRDVIKQPRQSQRSGLSSKRYNDSGTTRQQERSTVHATKRKRP